MGGAHPLPSVVLRRHHWGQARDSGTWYTGETEGETVIHSNHHHHAAETEPAIPQYYPPPAEYWPAPEYYAATVYGGCQEDGLDCRYSRCCARQGSRCFVKNDRWASCNESCFSHTQWEGAHHHGSWKRTNYPVWDCTDITTEGNVHASWKVAEDDGN